jgi:hypothetical protein
MKVKQLAHEALGRKKHFFQTCGNITTIFYKCQPLNSIELRKNQNKYDLVWIKGKDKLLPSIYIGNQNQEQQGGSP